MIIAIIGSLGLLVGFVLGATWAWNRARELSKATVVSDASVRVCLSLNESPLGTSTVGLLAAKTLIKMPGQEVEARLWTVVP